MRSFCILILLTAVGLLAATSGNLRDPSVSSSLLPSFVKDIIAAAPLQYLSSVIHGIHKRTSFTLQNTVTYAILSTFDDGSCTSLTTSVATQIKQCYKSAGNYTRTTSVLATGKVPTITTTRTNYGDSACTKVIGKPVTKIGSTVCASGQGGFVQSDISSEFVFHSTAAGIQINHFVDSDCQTKPVRIVYFKAGSCVAGKIETVSGSLITTRRFSNTTCSGPSIGDTYSVGDCREAIDKDGTFVTGTPVPASVFPFISSANPSSCFSGSDTVALESGGERALSQVRIGDRILGADAGGTTSFSEVVFIPHLPNSEAAVFRQITTDSGRVIKMTQNHILPAGVCGGALSLVRASNVLIGQCVLTVSGHDRVAAVENVHGEGVYTVVTNQEYVVVGGIIASPFGSNHMVANMYYNVHRLLHYLRFPISSAPLIRANEALGKMIFLAGLSF